MRKKKRWQRFITWYKNRKSRKKAEYSKRMLSFIVFNCIGMMWMSYVLAFCDRAQIAQALSETIASAVIAVVIGYLTKATLENISKHTTAFGENITPSPEEENHPE